MTPQQHADRFVARYNGEYIDEDGYYGSQCWDVSARYAREEWGCPYFPTSSGGAEGLYRLYQFPIPKFFDRVSGYDLKPGDIAVWDATFYPPWGHTSVVWRREGNYIWSFEQDGSKDPNGDGKADGVSYLVQRLITSKVNGLRPKGEAMADFEVLQQMSHSILGRTVPVTKEWYDKSAEKDQQLRQVVLNWTGSPEAQAFRRKGWDYDRLAKEFADYKKANPVGGGVYVPAGELFVKKEG